MTSFLSEMETLKIPEKVVFWAIEHVFLENPQRTDLFVYFLVEFWKGVHLRAAIKTALDSLFVESFKPRKNSPCMAMPAPLLFITSQTTTPTPPKKRHIRVSEGVYYGGEHD